MFMLGIHSGGRLQATTIALIKRGRKGVAKFYRVTAVEHLPAGMADEARAERIDALYRRRDLVTAKTRFSQVGRPRKRTRARPTVVVDGTGNDPLLAALQQRKIRFHAVLPCADGPDWQLRTVAGRTGSALSVPSGLLAADWDAVRRQGRIVFETAGPPDAGLVISVSICVWYEEHLLEIRRRDRLASQSRQQCSAGAAHGSLPCE